MTNLTPTRRGRCAGMQDWRAQYRALQMTGGGRGPDPGRRCAGVFAPDQLAP